MNDSFDCPYTQQALALFFALDAPDHDRYQALAPHLAHCPDCRRALAVIDKLAHTAPAVLEAAATRKHLDDAALATYSLDPDPHTFPEIAAHLEVCAFCRDELAVVREELNLSSPVAVELDDALPDIPTDQIAWEYVKARARYVVGPHTIATQGGRATLQGPLAGYIPPGGMPYAGQSTARSGADRTTTAIVADLRPPEQMTEPWVRVSLDILQLPTAFTIILDARLIALWGDTDPVCAVNLPWRVERHVGEQTETYAAGVTDAQGQASWSLSTPGEYTFVLMTDQGEWAIPLAANAPNELSTWGKPRPTTHEEL